MPVGPGPRFLIEAVFIVAVAVIAAVSKLSTVGIILSIGAAWAIVAAVEMVASRRAGTPLQGEVPVPAAGARRPLFARRARRLDAPTIAPEPTAAPPADDPGLQHVRVLPVNAAEATPAEPLPAPAPEPEPVAARPLAETIETPPAVEERPVPEPVAAASLVEPRPEPTPEPAPDPAPPAAPPPPEPKPIPVAPPTRPPVLAAAPPPPPEPVAPPTPAPAAPPQVVSIGPRGPVAWNLWELERLSREHAGQDTFKDEERSYLLIYLREFASADGILPADFDGLVRDSFGDLVSTA